MIANVVRVVRAERGLSSTRLPSRRIGRKLPTPKMGETHDPTSPLARRGTRCVDTDRRARRLEANQADTAGRALRPRRLGRPGGAALWRAAERGARPADRGRG